MPAGYYQSSLYPFITECSILLLRSGTDEEVTEIITLLTQLDERRRDQAAAPAANNTTDAQRRKAASDKQTGIAIKETALQTLRGIYVYSVMSNSVFIIMLKLQK